MAEAVEEHVDVYEVFDVDENKPWETLSHYFPDKVGGRPAWLVLDRLPPFNELKCGICGKPCVLLLQKYAPTENLHRTIFIFVCRDAKCCLKNDPRNFVVLRSQLPLDNRFYPLEPPDEDEFDMTSDYPRADKFTSLCVVCGCQGLKKCSRCKTATYCSQEHQKTHWLAGHKLLCCSENKDDKKQSCESRSILLPEWILDIPDDCSLTSESNATAAGEDWNSYCPETSRYSVAELEKMAADSSVNEDNTFSDFIKSVKKHPRQVLRYNGGGSPMWVTDSNIPSLDSVPNCDKCGAKRRFEFQVMPQLLNFLEVDSTSDSIDWATLAIFTCSADCSEGGQYGRECLLKQDY